MTNKNDKILAPIKGRVIQFIEYQRLEKKKIFEKLDVASSNFRGRALYSEISADIVAKILSLYPDCNAEWLLLGKGEMLKPEIQEQTASHNDKYTVSLEKINTLQEEKIASLEKTIKELKNKLQKTIAKQENDIINLQGEDISAMKSPNLPPDDPLQPSRGV